MTPSAARHDAESRQAMLHELGRDGRVEKTGAGVEGDHGVLLFGTVSSFATRPATQEAAHRTQKVRPATNSIMGQLPGTGTSIATAPTAAEVARTVGSALALNKAVPHERIRTRVAGGWVTLEGIVDLWSQREAAERTVRRTAGVRGLSSAFAVRARRSTQKRDRSSTPRRWRSKLSVAAAS